MKFEQIEKFENFVDISSNFIDLFHYLNEKYHQIFLGTRMQTNIIALDFFKANSFYLLRLTISDSSEEIICAMWSSAIHKSIFSYQISSI